MIDKYFSDAKSILLITAGGGRELIQLLNMGFDVDSYECDPYLVYFGNTLLGKQNNVNGIKTFPRNGFPEVTKKYDGIIIGWRASALIIGKHKRENFLNELRPFLKMKSPLMISFLKRKNTTRQNRLITFLANLLRFNTKSHKIKGGDYFIHNFVRYITKTGNH